MTLAQVAANQEQRLDRDPEITTPQDFLDELSRLLTTCQPLAWLDFENDLATAVARTPFSVLPIESKGTNSTQGLTASSPIHNFMDTDTTVDLWMAKAEGSDKKYLCYQIRYRQ